MNDELRTLVNDSMKEANATGAIVMYKLMTDHMVLRNQESIDALLEWIRHFDIRRYDGQNVKTAASQVRAVTRALEGFGLPGNIIRCILDGFAFADNAKFKSLCVTLGTLERASSIHAGRPEASLKQKCFAMLRDLEICFTDISAVHQWDGVGHVGATYFAGFDEGSAVAMAA